MAPIAFLCAALAVPSTAPADDWHDDIVYQIFPRSFADSNGDGIGDLRGILGKLDHLQKLGVNVVWINPVFKSTQYDSGYDVSDYLDIDPMFGTLTDFAALRDGIHKRGMKLVMDLVLNHSSDAHPWFVQEKRFKVLQNTITELVKNGSAAEAEEIVNLLGDPASFVDMPSARVDRAQTALQAFLADDAKAAVDSGYPTPTEQAALLGRNLAPCAEHHSACPDIALPLDDFYLWRDRPNNWTGIFSGSTWHEVEGSGGYYLALFSEHQVDLNWRNPRLRAAMRQIVRTWEERGVDGFRLDSIGTLSKDPTFPNAPPKFLGSTGRGLQFYTHLPPVHRYMRELATAYAPNFRTVGEVAFTKEHPEAPLAYAGIDRGEMNEIFVFEHMGVDCNRNKWRSKPFVLAPFKEVIRDQQTSMHNRAWLGNYLENHDQMRIVSRYGNDTTYRKESAKLFATLLFTLEGTPYIYQGQELGMTNLPSSAFKHVSDVEDIEARNYFAAQVQAGEEPAKVFHEISTRCRDHVRSAVQWSDAPNAGFTSGHSAVRVNDNYKTINAAQQEEDPSSVLRHYSRLGALRRSHRSWVRGIFEDVLPAHKQVVGYTRIGDGEKTLVLLNVSNADATIDLPETAMIHEVKDSLGNYATVPAVAKKMTLRPWEAVVYMGGAESAGTMESARQ